jgi:hypothetical protein
VELRYLCEMLWNSPLAAVRDAAVGVEPDDFDYEIVFGEIAQQVEEVGACAVVFRERIVTCGDQ